ncbi:permease [candidate division WOR-3 bacterium RBG_13_43_14]|uniref:Permease n=1 Tax=candidate division WOR-3 bacterium RBG_13_43_14 TaxID=1802590 RepID=A0A1F4UBK1_UNCW3|nr:MAG: permease [candidate division WOR-3 bacterium RBG_13_43_14]
MKDRTRILIFIVVFVILYFVPLTGIRLQGALLEAFFMVQEYAREHVLFCLIPAFFIAGAIINFISKEAIIRYFGPKANRILAYGVASVSGSVLAVCSCTVLPIFAGIYSGGAGIGPAAAFLYAGPAINVLAIILTARILGIEIGIARAVGSIVFAVIIGLLMSALFKNKTAVTEVSPTVEPEIKQRSLFQNTIYFVVLVLILIFAAWARPKEAVSFYSLMFGIKWYLTFGLLLLLGIILFSWFKKDELSDWVTSTWFFAKQILPLLFFGVMIAGFLLGRPMVDSGIIPSNFISILVGSNSISANFFAAIFGAFMYFATLTEVPILQGLLGSGMSKGPALALLLAGPAVSLPSMLVMRSIMGTKRTAVYILLVVLMSTVVGWLYGLLFA